MISAIRKYFKSCPHLKDGAIINVDSLGDDPAGVMKYSIEALNANPIIKKYADGGVLKQFVFAFCSREKLSEAGLKNLENSQFYEKLSEWVESQNKERKLPEFSDGKHVQSIEILTGGLLVRETGTTGKYEIQMRVIYYVD